MAYMKQLIEKTRSFWCMDALINTCVSCFSITANITSDRAGSSHPNYTCQALGIHHGTTTASHPQGNCLVERVHRQFL